MRQDNAGTDLILSYKFLCPAWIILRIAMGTAYSRSNTTSVLTPSNTDGSLVFASRGRSTLLDSRLDPTEDKFEQESYDMPRLYPQGKMNSV
jgi:hypothetical protein